MAKIIERIAARNELLGEVLSARLPKLAKLAALEQMLCARPESPGYAARVRQLEAEGLTTSDAQAVADAEEMQCGR